MTALWRTIRFYAFVCLIAPICRRLNMTWHWAPMMRLRWEYEELEAEGPE